jgi:hypothetical protein
VSAIYSASHHVFCHTLVLFPDLGHGCHQLEADLSIIILFPVISFGHETFTQPMCYFKGAEQSSTINTQIQENFAGIRVIQPTPEKNESRSFSGSMIFISRKTSGQNSGYFTLDAFLTGFFC